MVHVLEEVNEISFIVIFANTSIFVSVHSCQDEDPGIPGASLLQFLSKYLLCWKPSPPPNRPGRDPAGPAPPPGLTYVGAVPYIVPIKLLPLADLAPAFRT